MRFFVAISVCYALATGCVQAAPNTYIQTLEARARQQHLAKTRQWRALLHYEHNWLRAGVHSTVITPWFFLAANGRDHPGRELNANIAALFSRAPIGARHKPMPCLFPARRKFLIRALQIDRHRLPALACPRYQRWRRVLSAYKLSLVFPTAFPNSPSSMFGHTLLRIDSSRRRHGTELLAFAVNFAAAAGPGHKGLGFVWKGLTGGYAGVFGLFPYYKKVKQYAWIENRDVWSYPLHLTPAEISRLVDHLWEMDSVRFTYYFLNKNCSYQLLSLLEAARPRLHLTQQYSWYAIPSDTIRSLADVPGLLGAAHYRPSMETSLRWEADRLSPAERRLAIAVAHGKRALDSPRLTALSARNHAAVLEVAHDDLHYELARGHAKAKSGKARANAILVARSRIRIPSSFPPVPVPATPPDEGHRSLRVAVSGIYEDHNFSLGFRIRPAYHDLLDNPGGYTDDAEINFLDLGIRLDPAAGKLAVDDLRILNIVSLSPRSDLFKPVSFTLDTGIRRRPSDRVFTDAPNGLGYYFQGGPGLAWGRDDLLGYVFALASADANAALTPAYALGAGGAAGVLAYPLPGVQLRAAAGALEYVAGDNGYYRWARLAGQIPLVRDFALRASVGYEDTAVNHGLRAMLGLWAYF